MPAPVQIPYTHTLMTPQVIIPRRPIYDPTLIQNLQPVSIPAELPVELAAYAHVAKPVVNSTMEQPDSKAKNIKPDYNVESNVEEQKRKLSSEESKSDQGNAKPSAAGTYKHRNVYKSIIRHMHSCTRRQRNQLVAILSTSGFSMSEIEHAFYEIGCYNDMERQKGKKKISQSLVKHIASDKTIYTYVLRETLHSMLQSWQEGKYGRLTKKNVATYSEVCTKYYNETVRVLGQPAQILNFQS